MCISLNFIKHHPSEIVHFLTSKIKSGKKDLKISIFLIHIFKKFHKVCQNNFPVLLTAIKLISAAILHQNTKILQYQ